MSRLIDLSPSNTTIVIDIEAHPNTEAHPTPKPPSHEEKTRSMLTFIFFLIFILTMMVATIGVCIYLSVRPDNDGGNVDVRNGNENEKNEIMVEMLKLRLMQPVVSLDELGDVY